MLKKTLKALLLFLLFLSLTSITQDPEKKKKEKEREPIVRDTLTYVSERTPDSLYLEQKALNIKLDSLLLEKQKKK